MVKKSNNDKKLMAGLNSLSVFLCLCVTLICMISFFVNLKVLALTGDFRCLLLALVLAGLGSACLYSIIYCAKDLWRSV